MNRNQKYQELKDKAQELKGKVIGIVEQTYPNDFRFIRTLLTNQIIKDSETQLAQVKIGDRLSKIQEQIDTLQTTFEQQYQKVKEQYKQYIAIATDTLAQNQDQIRQQYCCLFSCYRNIVNQRIKLIETLYYQNIEFEQNGTRFKDHCKYVFDGLLTKDIEGQQKINLNTFNSEAQKVVDQVAKKYQNLNQKVGKQTQVNWPQIHETIFTKLYQGWQLGMNESKIDELLDLKKMEYQIQWGKQLEMLKVKEIVEAKYPQEFGFVRRQLIIKINNDIEIYLSGNTSVPQKQNYIKEQQTNLYYSKHIEIAIRIYKDNEQFLFSQKFLDFYYYKTLVKDKINQIQGEYKLRINPITLDGDQFQKHCQQIFDELFYIPFKECKSINLEIFKQYAYNAYQYVTYKFKSLKMRMNEDQSINWVEEEKKIFAKLYNGWTQGMDDNQIDELIDLKSYEQRKPQIKQVNLPEQIPEKVKDIGEELRQQVQVLVETNYIQEFKFIRTLLKEKIFYDMQQVPEFLNLLQNDMQQAVQSQYNMIVQYYKIYREAAFEIYNFNKNQIMQQQCSQFTYYQIVGKRLEWSWSQYIEQVPFIQQPDQFNVQCQALFNKLFNEPIQGQPKINLEEFNKNTSQAMTYVTNQFNSMQQKIRKQYENDVTLVNWGQIQNQVLGKLYKGWKPKMEEYEIQRLLQIKEQEKQILSEIKLNQIVKAFIEMAGKNGHYYLFDEEYQMINQNSKIQEIQVQSSSPDILAKQYYKEILETLKIDEQIQVLKNTLIDTIRALNWIPINLSNSFKRQVIHLYFNQIRNSVFQRIGYCSFQWFKGQYTQDQQLVNALVGCLPRDPEQIKFLTQNIQMEQNAVIEKLRTQFKSIIISEEEYRQVIDQNDPLFLEIVHPSNHSGLDEDQELYLEKQIDKFQKTKFLEWLSKCQRLCKEELLKHQEIEEQELTQQFQTLQVKIQETIKNKLQQLNQSKTLMEQFQAKWIQDEWQEKVNNIQNTLLKLMNQNSIFPYIIDFRCRSQQITNFLVGKNLQVLFDDNYKFGTITLDRSRSIDFETYFQLINNKILFFAFEDLRKIIILMFEFVKRLLQNNLNLNGNYDWKQMVIQLDQDGQFEGVILLNLQEEVSQNIIIFATIVFQLGDKLKLSNENLDILRTLVDELTRNNFTNNAQMQVENNSNNKTSWKEYGKSTMSTREKLQKQINKAVTAFNNNKPQNIQDTPLDIRCKLQINNAQFMKILLNPNPQIDQNTNKKTNFNSRGNNNSKQQEEKSPLQVLVEGLKQRYYAIDRRLVHNLKDKGEIQQWFQNLQNRQKLDEFILQYLQMIGLFNQTNFEIEVIVIQFQIHIQQCLQTYYLSKEQLPTLDGYLEKVVILECIESSCILTECKFESKLSELKQSMEKLKQKAEFRSIECVDEDYLKLFTKFGLNQRKTLQDYFVNTNPQLFLDQLLNHYPDYLAIKNMKNQIKQYIQNRIVINGDQYPFEINELTLPEVKQSVYDQLNFYLDIIEGLMQ